MLTEEERQEGRIVDEEKGGKGKFARIRVKGEKGSLQGGREGRKFRKRRVKGRTGRMKQCT